MKPSDAADRDADLPPALSSMWRLCKIGYQHEPALMSVAFGLALLAALPEALLAVGFAATWTTGRAAGRRPGPGRQRVSRVTSSSSSPTSPSSSVPSVKRWAWSSNMVR